MCHTVLWSIVVLLMEVWMYVRKAHGGDINWSPQDVTITCTNDTLEELSPINKSFTTATITACPLPRDSYATALSALSFNTSLMHSLVIQDLPLKTSLRDEHFAGLFLLRLEIHQTQFHNYIYIVRDYSSPAASSGMINFTEGKELIVSCEDSTLDNESVMLFDRVVRVTSLHIDGCSPPQDSYASIFRALGVDVTSVTNLVLNIQPDPPLRATHFANLSVQRLYISPYIPIETLIPEEDFLNPLIRTLLELHLSNMEITSLPSAIKVKHLTMNYGDSIGALGGCEDLQRLDITNWEVSELTSGFLDHCPRLKELTMVDVSPETIQQVLKNASRLPFLSIRRSKLGNLTEKLFDNAIGLKRVNLAFNKLQGINDKAFASQSQLLELDLSDNLIKSFSSLQKPLQPLRKLKKLTLDRNPLRICTYTKGLGKRRPQPKPLQVEHLSLRRTSLWHMCFGTWNNLTYLDLSENSITELDFRQLPIPGVLPLEVDLRSNPIKSVPQTEEDHDLMIKKYNQTANVTIYLDITPLDCDCRYGWFARALRKLPHLSVLGVRCSSGQLLADASPKQLECHRITCSGCSCAVLWEDNTTIADCRNAKLDTVPRVTHLNTLIAPNNRIETLHKIDLPETLQFLDISYNYVSYMTAEAVGALFAVPTRRMRLVGNPFVCDCDNWPLLVAMQTNHTQIVDYDNVTCVGTGVAIRDIVINHLCHATRERFVLVASATSTALLACMVLGGALYYRYRRYIKMYLYARGYCLCCVREDDVDADRQYDAFISFSHEDEEFVAVELLPKLDQHAYKLCIHTRDWFPGELIPTQIVRSVEQSRRTVVVLSQNFVKSMWGMLEFRTAYVRALREGRVRVIIIVLDDVVDDKCLDPELRGYLRTNTYVRWKDPWFWQKLLYALPHRSGDVDMVLSTKRSTYRRRHRCVEDSDATRMQVSESTGQPICKEIQNIEKKL